MTTVADFAEALRQRLDAADSRLDLWWRDDDATAPSPALDRLLELARRHSVPLALAVIPQPTGMALADRLSGETADVAVIQHGFAHRNHAPAGEKSAELGAHRPIEMVIGDLVRGREKLERLFPCRFLPVLTPPWNRIGEAVAARRGEAGLAGLSTFAEMHGQDPACANTHIDIIDWKGGRVFAGYDKMTKVLGEEIGRRSASPSEPLGLLTHHLDHDAGAWTFLETFLSVAARHPAVRWPGLADIFGFGQGR
jgi:hypothetical protein